METDEPQNESETESSTSSELENDLNPSSPREWEPDRDPELERLEKRLQDLKTPDRPNRKFARGVALVTTLGFLVVGCILAGYYLGSYLEAKYDSQFFLIAGLLGGIGAAAYAGYRTMQPLLENDE